MVLGKQYADLWNQFPAAMWNNVPQSDLQARNANTATRQTVPWAMENTPMPLSGAHAEHSSPLLTPAARRTARDPATSGRHREQAQR